MSWNLLTDRPIYLQIIEHIKYSIISGEYHPGDKLPSIRELAADAAVNPNTMQKALTELERAKLIYTNRTSGKFITEDDDMIQDMKQSIAKSEILKFLEGMKKLGFTNHEAIELVNCLIKENSKSSNT